MGWMCGSLGEGIGLEEGFPGIHGDFSGDSFDGFAGAGKFVELFSAHFDGGIHGRDLFLRTGEFLEGGFEFFD